MSRKSFLKAKIFFYLTLNFILSKRNDSCFCLKQNKRKNKKNNNEYLEISPLYAFFWITNPDAHPKFEKPLVCRLHSIRFGGEQQYNDGGGGCHQNNNIGRQANNMRLASFLFNFIFDSIPMPLQSVKRQPCAHVRTDIVPAMYEGLSHSPLECLCMYPFVHRCFLMRVRIRRSQAYGWSIGLAVFFFHLFRNSTLHIEWKI